MCRPAAVTPHAVAEVPPPFLRRLWKAIVADGFIYSGRRGGGRWCALFGRQRHCILYVYQSFKAL